MNKEKIYDLDEKIIEITALTEQINSIAFMLKEQISNTDLISIGGASTIITLSELVDKKITLIAADIKSI